MIATYKLEEEYPAPKPIVEPNVKSKIDLLLKAEEQEEKILEQSK